MAVINDTVGTMMTCGYDDHLCEVGLIVGECSQCGTTSPESVLLTLCSAPAKKASYLWFIQGLSNCCVSTTLVVNNFLMEI